jgi:hypothetical protein
MECTSPSKDELLASIKPDMVLTKQFIKRIYGYGVTDASFPDKAITALEVAGCSKARAYYEDWVNEYERSRKQEEGEERRRQKIQSLTREELTELCQKLLQEGVIEKPEQFATAVLQGK